MNITLEQAESAIKAAKEKAKQLNTLMNIAVVDAGTNLVAFAKMDNAWLGSIDIAQRKARTARYFNMDSGKIGELSQPGGPLYNIEHSNGRGLPPHLQAGPKSLYLPPALFSRVQSRRSEPPDTALLTRT